MQYEDLRAKLLDRYDVHDLVDLLNIIEDDILDEFKNKVIDNLEEIYEALGYNEGEDEEIEY